MIEETEGLQDKHGIEEAEVPPNNLILPTNFVDKNSPSRPILFIDKDH